MVTVVVPVYNAEKYLDECILSILGQSYGDFELLMFIGKCTDFSREICEKYRQKDSRIQLYDQIKVGPGGARNQGLDMAKGEYIYFCDADDFMTKDCLKTFVTLAKAGDHDIVESNTIMLTQNGNEWKATPFGCSFWAINVGHDSVERSANPAVWKYFSRVDLWRNNNLRFADFLTAMDDLATYSLLFKSSKNPLYILDNLYCYRVFDGSLSRTPAKFRNRLQNIFTIIDYLSSEFRKRNMFEENRFTLASQLEHHSKLVLRDIPDLTSDERIEICQKLSASIRDKFEVSTSTYDCGCFSWGSPLVHALSKRMSLCPVKGMSFYEEKSIWSVTDAELEEIALDITSHNENVAIIDLIYEIANLNEIEDMEIHLKEWKAKFSRFVEKIKESLSSPGRVIVVENYYNLLDYSGPEIVPFSNGEDLEFYNEVLTLYYNAAKEVLPADCFAPPAPLNIMFSETGDATEYNACVVVYHLDHVTDMLR